MALRQDSVAAQHTIFVFVYIISRQLFSIRLFPNTIMNWLEKGRVPIVPGFCPKDYSLIKVYMKSLGQAGVLRVFLT